MSKFLRSLTIIIISFFAWIATFELISTYWIARWGDPLDKAKQVLVTDRWLGWRQKANFNGKFLNISLKTNELGLRNKPLSEIKKTSKNILILGPSSTFGWGVEGYQTYSFILEELLTKKYPSVKINVINAGQIGFSSWQGLQFYSKWGLKELKVNIIIIAYGVNDVDRFRFFYATPMADKEEFAIPKKAWEISLQNFLIKFNSINLLSRKMLNLFDNFGRFQTKVPTRRVENFDFSRNIENLIQLGESNGSEIILLASAYKLPFFDTANSEIEKLSQKYFNTGKNKYEEKQYSQALSYFKKAVEIKPDQNEIYYYLSFCYSHLGDFRNRKKGLKKARQSEPKRIANDINELNNILRDIAKKEGIILIDTKECFALLKDNDMFLDPIHMSVRGNEIIARNLSAVISENDLLKINKEH